MQDRSIDPDHLAGQRQDGVRHFDTEGAARYIGCTPGYMKNLRVTGEGPRFTRLFRRKGIRYEQADLDRWREGRRFGSTSEYPESLR